MAGDTLTVEGWLRLDNDFDFEPNMTFNISDPSNTYLLNYNQTVQGFQNKSGLTGTFTGPFLPPIEIQAAVNKNDIQTFTVCGLAEFKSDWILSGSSESWWRVPERGPYYSDMVNLTIWNVGSPSALNFTDSTVPNLASHPRKVHDFSYSLDESEKNSTFYWYNTTAWEHQFNSTWVRVNTQIYGGESYAIRWEMTNRSTWAKHWLRLSQNDMADDGVFNTWLFYPNGTRDNISADLDISVLHTYGMGYSVSGNEIDYSFSIDEYDPFEDEDGVDLQVHNPYWNYYSESAGTSFEIDNSVVWDGTSSLKVIMDDLTSYFGREDMSKGGVFYQEISFKEGPLGFRYYGYNSAFDNILQWRMSHSGNYLVFYFGNGADGSDTTAVYYSETDYLSVRNWYDIPNNRQKMQVRINNGTWNIVDVPVGCPDYGDGWGNFRNDFTASYLHTFFYYFLNGIGTQWFDNYYFNESGTINILFQSKLSEEITENDNLTIMMPFFESVDNSSNVRIAVSTLNDSWATYFWVAEHGPTDFGLKSWTWDVAWPADEFKINCTFQNVSRKLWIYDRNTLLDPDIEYEFNRYQVTQGSWEPKDYYFGGVPYHALQITNGSWVNADPPAVYYLGGRLVDDPSTLVRNAQFGDDWLLQFWISSIFGGASYADVARVTAAFSYAITGQWDQIGPALNPKMPFPTDAPWYFGKYLFPAAIAAGEFIQGLESKIWSAMVWIYEGLVWIAKAASWFLAGTLKVFGLFFVIMVWARYWMVIGGLIKWGWITARDGLVAGSEFASEFWSRYISTSYIKKIATKGG